MSKIVRAVNAMLSQPEKISGAIAREGRYFFLYDRKYKWSIQALPGGDNCLLIYYPGEDTLEELAIRPGWEEEKVVAYRSEDLGTKEAFETFRELHTTVKERLLNVNEALDDIISSGGVEPPF